MDKAIHGPYGLMSREVIAMEKCWVDGLLMQFGTSLQGLYPRPLALNVRGV